MAIEGVHFTYEEAEKMWHKIQDAKESRDSEMRQNLGSSGEGEGQPHVQKVRKARK
jgi:predicted DNA repair protein MutK